MMKERQVGSSTDVHRGLTGNPGQANTPAQSGLVFTKSLAREWLPRITVNAVAPASSTQT